MREGARHVCTCADHRKAGNKGLLEEVHAHCAKENEDPNNSGV